MMGIIVDAATLADWERRGLIPPQSPTPPPGFVPAEPEDDGKPALLPTIFSPPARWQIGLETRSLSNLRDWRQRNRLTNAARKAVSKAMGPHLRWLATFAEVLHQRAGKVHCTFTRVAPRMLDASNVPAALKPVEDALMLLMGADDGWHHWHPQWLQVVGPMMGVIVEMRVEE